jgi:replicative DNA helicase
MGREVTNRGGKSLMMRLTLPNFDREVIRQETGRHMYKSLRELLEETEIYSSADTSYKTGYEQLDERIGGVQNSDLVLVSAKEGNYGSVFMQNLAVGLSKSIPVLYFSCERPGSFCVRQFKSILDSKSSNERKQVNLAGIDGHEDKLFIEDSVRFLEDLDSMISRFKANAGIDAIVLIDNLNSLFLTKEIHSFSREKEEFEISVRLKMLTLKHQLPILVFHRIKSANNADEANVPAPVDYEHLEGDSLQFDAILALHRPEYYKIDADLEGNSTENKLNVHIQRAHNGHRSVCALNISRENRFLLT